jgi:ligand-binding SRPBCC domain-containing protein
VKTYNLKFEQYLPIPLAEAWHFFSSPNNLEKITPPQMKFVVTSPDSYRDDENTKMYPGMIITYKITPIFNIKMNWVTEISQVKENEYFVDEQRIGPYALWHHQHHFKEVKGGVLMTDTIHYAIPYGIIGRLANDILVERQVKHIFDYRAKEIVKLFGVFRG